mgnify:CR=1 FL=1
MGTLFVLQSRSTSVVQVAACIAMHTQNCTYKEAKENFSKALRFDPKNLKARLREAECLFQMEELEKVKTELEAARASISALRRVEKVTVTTLAVDQEGRGVALKLEVFTRTGKGNVLIDISGNILYDETVQESMLIAVAVAQEVTKRSLVNKDLYFRLINPFEVTAVVGGGSAGAAMCMAAIALLTGKTVKPNVAITGTIKPDGTIGRVGGLRAKALAAKAAGITILLVPKGQGAEVGSVPGLTVIEVSNIREAMAYMLA